MGKPCVFGVLAALSIFLRLDVASAAISGITRVASSLTEPIFATYAPGDRTRLFIAGRHGTVYVLNLETGALNPSPFLQIPDIDATGEGGLLGFAFHPQYQSNGKFYVYMTAGDSDPTTYYSSYVRQYTVSTNPDIAKPSFTPVLNFGQPQSNHNGGWIGFNPQVTPGQPQYLYVASGDGGGAFDLGDYHNPEIGNAQDITDNLLGKMLRIDVDGDAFPGNTPAALAKNYAIPPTNPFADTVDNMGMPVVVTGDDEIWSYGLRNPFRSSFDRITGDLWIGDVGQNQREEVDFEAASEPGGRNYGWRYREGTVTTEIVGQPYNPAFTQPVYEYDRPIPNPNNDPAITEMNKYRGVVISGGYVYRGPDPSLQGKYFFLDSLYTLTAADDNYWMFDPADPYGTVTNITSLLTADTGLHEFPVAYGEDAVGNLYVIAWVSGEVYRIKTNQLLAGDYDADGDVDNEDYGKWRTSFGTSMGNRPADGNGNGIVDAADYVVWRNNFGAGVHADAGSEAAATVPELPALVYLLELAAALFSTLLFHRRPRLAHA